MFSTPLKNMSQNGNLPQIRGEHKKYPKPPNSGAPKSPILIGLSIIYHPFWGFSPYLGNTRLYAITIIPSLRRQTIPGSRLDPAFGHHLRNLILEGHRHLGSAGITNRWVPQVGWMDGGNEIPRLGGYIYTTWKI